MTGSASRHAQPAVRAVILAAGRGERLRPLTDDRPKALVAIAGRSVLAWQLDALRACGIADVAVVTGYRGDLIRAGGVTCVDNPAWRRSNMVVSLLHAREWLRAGPCIVAYGDVVYHPATIAALAQTADPIAMPYDIRWRRLWEARFARPQDDAESLRIADGRVVEIGAPVRDLDAVDGQFMGLLKLEPAGWDRIESELGRLDAATVARLQTTHLLARLVGSGVRIAAVPIAGRWCELDSVADLELYEAELRARPDWTHDWRPLAGGDA